MSMKRLETLLVANRGEIAVRVMRSARALGIRTVAVYSEADADAPHVAAADVAVAIGPAPVGESYLSVDRILAAAAKTGAQAIHPGYGFLSENAAFAQRCADAGLVFVGPPPEAIRLMGDKVQAKLRMIEAGVPTAPGIHAGIDDLARVQTEIERIGLPVLVKASAGGGGRGMRIVRTQAELAPALQTASSEAANAFGSGEVFVEKLVEGARHVEIQVFADRHGHVIHLGERECSVQRRHQKIVEESPSAVVGSELRTRMGDAAVAAAQAIGYVGAGTVEFLLDDDGKFYFLEMNTRLQVEHPVTELVTGFDLVEWQLRIAEGEKLPVRQQDVAMFGHAIEVRLYAEDPWAGFLPQTGPVLRWRPSAGDGVRVDAGIREGQEVSPFYDPMLAKICAWAPTRDVAIRRMRAALRDTVLLGTVTNRAYLHELVGSEAFASASIKTDTLDRDAFAQTGPRPEPDALAWAVAAVARCVANDRSSTVDGSGWRSSGVLAWPVTLRHADAKRELVVDATSADRFTVRGASHEPLALRIAGRDELGRTIVEHDGLRRALEVVVAGAEVWVDDAGHAHAFVEPTIERSAAVEGGAAGGVVRAPMGGRVVRVEVAAGDEVERGRTLVVIEAMKMEHRVLAPIDGRVSSVGVTAGGQVAVQAIVAVIEAKETTT